MSRRPQFGGFDTRIPPFTKKVILILFVVYMAELILHNWVGLNLERFAWSVNPKEFSIWQPLSSFFVIGIAQPLTFLLDLLMIFFFLPPLQRTYGRRAIYKMLSITVEFV